MTYSESSNENGNLYLKQGVAAWNNWRAADPVIVPDLSRADLSGANLSGANLSGANLSDAYLSDADLSGADLRDANLRGADLSGADLSGANLARADLSGAFLSGADLRGADLSGADLSGADLSGADLSGADLRGANLSGTGVFVLGQCTRGYTFLLRVHGEPRIQAGRHVFSLVEAREHWTAAHASNPVLRAHCLAMVATAEAIIAAAQQPASDGGEGAA